MEKYEKDLFVLEETSQYLSSLTVEVCPLQRVVIYCAFIQWLVRSFVPLLHLAKDQPANHLDVKHANLDLHGLQSTVYYSEYPITTSHTLQHDMHRLPY